MTAEQRTQDMDARLQRIKKNSVGSFHDKRNHIGTRTPYGEEHAGDRIQRAPVRNTSVRDEDDRLEQGAGATQVEMATTKFKVDPLEAEATRIRGSEQEMAKIMKVMGDVVVQVPLALAKMGVTEQQVLIMVTEAGKIVERVVAIEGVEGTGSQERTGSVMGKET